MKKTYMKNGLNLTCMGLLLVFLLGGCGGESNPMGGEITEAESIQEESSENPTKEDYEKEYLAKEPYDVFSGNWVEAGELQKPTVNWSVIDYQSDIFHTELGGMQQTYYGFRTTTDGAKAYAITTYYEEKDGQFTPHDIFMWFDTDTLKKEEMELDTTAIPPSMLIDFDCSGEQKLFFYQDMDENSDMNHLHVAALEEGNKLTLKGDLMTMLTEIQAVPQRQFVMSGDLMYDSRGFIYYITELSNHIYVVKEDGTIIGSDADLNMTTGMIEILCKTRDGQYIFVTQDSENKSTVYFCFDGEKMKKLSTDDYSFATATCINPYGEMYSVKNGMQIVCRNLKTGNYETCYVGTMDNFNGIVSMLQNSRGEIFCIKQEDSGEYSANVFSPVGVARSVTLNLYNYYYAGNEIRTAVTEYQRKHPGIKINLKESKFDDRDNDWMKLSADFTKGEGPDLMVLPRERMVELAKKGVLKNLGQVLPDEVESQVFTGVLDYGRWNDELYGLTYSGTPSTYLVSNEIWTEDGWTLQDVMKLLNDREASGESYTAFCNDWDCEDGLSALQAFYFLLEGMDDSPFLDLQNRTCHFDCEEFISILEYCRKNHVPVPESVYLTEADIHNVYRSVKTGNLLTYRMGGNGYSGGFRQFSEAMANLGENYHMVGAPSDSKTGYYFTCYETVCVRQGAENEDVIYDFLNSLFDLNMQGNPNTIRRDILEKSIRIMDYDRKYHFNVPGTRSYYDLATKKDGTTYLQEYLELCDRCTVKSEELVALEMIYDEELDAYFNGNKTAKEVAGIIQSRISLYLAENN